MRPCTLVSDNNDDFRERDPGPSLGNISLPVILQAPPLVQLPAKHRVTCRERPSLLILRETAHVHLQLRVEIVRMVDDETLRNQRQPWRAPLYTCKSARPT
jgi:hypothetical protein